jgi:PadR family transcriptional regulator, regulatory protein AphA
MLPKPSAQPSRSRTRFLILGLLREGPLSGYAIARLTQLRFRDLWRESYGQIYPELGRLAEKGLVSELPGEGTRGRRSWALTDKGAAALKAWLEEAESSDQARLETLLKVSFASAAPGSLERTLSAFRAKIAAELEGLERMETELRSVPDPHKNHQCALMTIDLEIATYRAWVDWAKRYPMGHAPR